jgi:hypothetical protein
MLAATWLACHRRVAEKIEFRENHEAKISSEPLKLFGDSKIFKTNLVSITKGFRR